MNRSYPLSGGKAAASLNRMWSRDPAVLLQVSPAVALLLALGGCGGDGGGFTFPPTTGTLLVTTSTTGDEIDPDGYTVQLDGGAPQAIGVSASLELTEVEPGEHTLRLDGMAANCSVAENPKTVTVVAGESATSAFEITCTSTSGAVVITTNTAGSSIDPDGYAVVLDGVEQGTIPATGQVTLSGLPLGSHVIGLSGLAGNCQVQGENLRAVTVIPAGSTPVDYAVSCATPPPNAGTLRIITNTTGNAPAPAGYSFAVDGGLTQPIGANDIESIINVAAGTHQVLLSNFPAECNVQGTNPRSVNVTAGGSTDASFTVSCTRAEGSIRVNVSTSGNPADPDGYLAQLDNAAPGVRVPADGSVRFTGVAVGSHTVTLTEVAANCSVAEGPSRTVAVTTGNTANVSFRVDCAAEASNRLEKVSGDDQSAEAGTQLPQPLVVRVVTPSGDPVPGVTVQWTAEGGGSVSAPSTQTDAAGRATVNRTLGPNVGQQSTRAAAAGLDGSPVIFTHTATGNPGGGPARLQLVSGDNQRGTVGSQLADPLVVKVTDASSQPVAGVAVHWAAQGGGSVSAEMTTTNENGLTSITRTLGPNAGAQSTTASVDGLTGSPVTFRHTAEAGSAARIEAVSGDNQSAPSGSELPADIVVRVLDENSNPIENVVVNWVVTDGDGSVSPETSRSDAQGLARTRWTLGPTSGSNRLSAVAGSARVSFTATSENRPPSPAFTPPSCVANQPCTFTDESTDPDGSIAARVWDFGDQSTSEQSPVDHVYQSAGTYTVTLVVTDNEHVTRDVSHDVTVAPAANTSPNAHNDDYAVTIGHGLHAPAENRPGLLENDQDPEGDQLAATGETKTTRQGGSVTISEDGSFDYTPPPDFTGTDDFEYTAVDGHGGSSTAVVTITVQPEAAG